MKCAADMGCTSIWLLRFLVTVTIEFSRTQAPPPPTWTLRATVGVRCLFTTSTTATSLSCMSTLMRDFGSRGGGSASRVLPSILRIWPRATSTLSPGSDDVINALNLSENERPVRSTAIHTWSSNILVTVILICLFVGTPAYLRNHTPNFLCMLPVARTSSDVTRYVMYFRFCGYASRFYKRDPLCATCVTADFNQFFLNDKDQQVHIVGCAPGAKSVIYDCPATVQR